MNDYYALYPAFPCKGTKNIYPQIVEPIASRNSEEYYLLTNLRNKPNVDAKGLVIELELDSKTVPTDFISQSWLGVGGLLVSENALDFFSEFSLQGEMECYTAILHYRGKKLNYFWLNPVKDFDTMIDYSATKFYLYDYIEETKKDIYISDVNDFTEKIFEYQSGYYIMTDELFVVDKGVFELDLFLMTISKTRMRASKRLKIALERSDLTGYEFSSAIPFGKL